MGIDHYIQISFSQPRVEGSLGQSVYKLLTHFHLVETTN